jgi:hypothetical protein
MNNFELYQLALFIIDKDENANRIRPSEFEISLIAKNIIHFRRRLGIPEGYQPGTAIMGAGATRMIDADLLPFYKSGDVAAEGKALVPDGNGKITIADAYYIDDFNTDTSRSSSLISGQKKSNRLNNAVTKPTVKDIAGSLAKGGLQVYPKTLTSVNVWYWRLPIAPVFKTTVDGSNEEVYDVGVSTELEWDDGNRLAILHMILQDIGVNVEKSMVEQYAVKLTETGK